MKICPTTPSPLTAHGSDVSAASIPPVKLNHCADDVVNHVAGELLFEDEPGHMEQADFAPDDPNDDLIDKNNRGLLAHQRNANATYHEDARSDDTGDTRTRPDDGSGDDT
eukprot:jgi/Psemu1/28417/gm1.28417_g